MRPRTTDRQSRGRLLFVLFGVSIIVFMMIRLIPGDAVAIMLGANTQVTPEALAADDLLRISTLTSKELVIALYHSTKGALNGRYGGEPGTCT